MVDFTSLVGTRVNAIAKVQRISYNAHLTSDYVLLEDVYVQSEYFRDHLFIKRSKRLEGVRKDDVISFTATVIEYLDIEDVNKMKLGLNSIRNVSIVKL